MRKAKSGEPITVGFLGGSITQGCLSSTPETCYAYLVYEWWKKQFPDTSVTYVNAGIGGTTSQFGVAREIVICYPIILISLLWNSVSMMMIMHIFWRLMRA